MPPRLHFLKTSRGNVYTVCSAYAAQKGLFQPSDFKALCFVRPTIYPDLLLITSMWQNVNRPGVEKKLPIDNQGRNYIFSKTYLAKQISSVETFLQEIWLE